MRMSGVSSVRGSSASILQKIVQRTVQKPARKAAESALPGRRGPVASVPPRSETLPAGAPPAGRPPDWRLTSVMLGLTALIGFNSSTVRVLVQEMGPMMGLALRGAVGLVPLTIYGLMRGESFRYRGEPLLHLLIASLLFSLEFINIYQGARYTTAGHVSILLNTSPLFTAIFAHFIIRDDRLYAVKICGLTVATAGIVLLFSEQLWNESGEASLYGDALVLLGALAWGLFTVYVKRTLSHVYSGFQILYMQVLISTPIFAIASWIIEPDPFFAFTYRTLGIVVFQGFFMVFLTYLVFMSMLRTYAASSVISYTLLSPIWGVSWGIVLLGEPASWEIFLTLATVGGGLYLVNRRRRPPRRT